MMNKNQKIFRKRSRIKNIGHLILLLLPLYFYVYSKLFENKLTINENAKNLEIILFCSVVIWIICMIQYRCPSCGHVIDPRQFSPYRCPSCDEILNLEDDLL